MANPVRRRRLAAILLVSVMAATWGTVAPSLAARPSAARDSFSPLVASVLSPPHPVLGADDQRHLAYELHVTNPTPLWVRLARVQAIDADTGAVIRTLRGPALTALTIRFAAKRPGTTFRPGGSGVIIMDAPVPRAVDLPRNLVHRFFVSLTASAPTLARRFLTARTNVVREHPVAVHKPLRGDRWVALNGCCDDMGHRAAVLPINGAWYAAQRFAIDLLQLDAQGRLFNGPVDELSSYPFYGNDVLSVADGVVVRVKDGVPDNKPGTVPPNPTPESAGGNYVIVDLGDDHFAFYAHLVPGSPRVEVGDRVETGEVLGSLGNSGNSTAPHLHFHVSDGPSPLASDGLPYVFRSFDSEGTVTGIDPLTIDPALSGSFRNRLPLNLQLIDF